MRRLAPIIIALVSLAAAARLVGQEVFPGADDKWQCYQSPNFELFSRNDDRDSRALLHDLEILRAVFFDTFKMSEKRRLPVTIYYFKSDKEFRPYGAATYGMKHAFAGFYVRGVDRAVILLKPGDDDNSTRALIFHEYVHHLFSAAEQNPPPWLNEGMAELFSTIKLAKDRLEVGHPVAGRLYQLQQDQMLPLAELFAVRQDSSIFRQGEHIGLFYSEAWALMHYLYYGESRFPEAARRRFMARVLAEPQMEPARLGAIFQEAFGIDYPEMQKRLERYVNTGRYYWSKVPVPDVAPEKSYAVRPMSRAEINLRLAELALRSGRSPLGKLALLQQLGTGDTRALEALGNDALGEADELHARERWEQAAAAGSRNPAIYRALARLECQVWFARFDVSFRLPAENARKLREYLLRSIEYNPEQGEAYEMLAWIEAFAPGPSIPNVVLVQKHLPAFSERARTSLALAFVRVRLGKFDEAREILADIEKLNPDDWVVYGIEATRAFIEKRPINPGNLRSRPGVTQPPGPWRRRSGAG